MLRSAVLIAVLACSFLSRAQSGTAFHVHCSSVEEIDQKKIRVEVARTEPKAVVIFDGSDVWMRFKLPQEGSAFSDLLWRTGLSDCRSRAIVLRENGSGLSTQPDGSSGSGEAQQVLPLEQR